MDTVDIRRLDFNLLLVFLALMRHRKATAAADELSLTQSTVSHALARLRGLFGDELFLRRPNGLAPTHRAFELEPRVRAIVESARAALASDETFDPASAAGLVRIGASDHLCALIGPPLLRRLGAAAPGLVPSLRPLIRREASDALAAGELDLALGFFWSVPPGLVALPLYEESYAVIARRDHPTIDAKGLDIAAYAAADHVLLSYDGEAHGVVDRALGALGRRRRVACTVPYVFAVLAAVAESDAIAAAFCARFGLLALTPPLPIRPFEVSLVWHDRAETSRMRRWVVQEIAACLA